MHVLSFLFLITSLTLSNFLQANEIGGTVLNERGVAEAGVWVIAETAELETDYRKIVVTDQQGKFVVPELPRGQLRSLGSRLRVDGLRENAGEEWRELEAYREYGSF